MKTAGDIKRRIIANSKALALIMIFASLLVYLFPIYAINSLKTLARIVGYIFPHEVFELLKILLFSHADGFEIYSLPVFTWLLGLFLLFSIFRFSKKNNVLPLQISLYTLASSIVWSVPMHITGYFDSIKMYEQYGHPSPGATGIIKLLDEFSAVSKPSLALFVLKFIILLGYIIWIIYILRWVSSFERQFSKKR